MLDSQENVTSLAVRVHEALVLEGFIADNDITYDAIQEVIDEFAGFPYYRHHN